MKFNALKYYLKSIKTLLQNTNYWMIPLVLIRKPILISTKSIKLWVSNLMDIWTLKEVILDHQYE